MSNQSVIKRVLSIQSHVVYGCAGNSAAVFPMQLLGAEVWPLHTVQFSSHTAYPQWCGTVLTTTQLQQIFDGIVQLEQLSHCDAVISGYLGSVEQGEAILSMVAQLKKANPQALYFCDPVMGSVKKTGYVAGGVDEFFKHQALPVCDIISPNFAELQYLVGSSLTSLADVILACRTLCEQGPKLILVKHLDEVALTADQFELLLVSVTGEVFHIARPLVDFPQSPVGMGDLISGLLLVNLLQGKSLIEALQHTNAAAYEVMLVTQQLQQRELQLVAAQQRIIHPSYYFKAEALHLA